MEGRRGMIGGYFRRREKRKGEKRKGKERRGENLQDTAPIRLEIIHHDGSL